MDLRDLLGTPPPPEYPIVEDDGNRVQLIMGENRYAIMLQHPIYSHWNGYVLIPKAKWDQREWNIEAITYAGPRGRMIGWMLPTQQGKLSIPASLAVTDEQDFWIGFDGRDTGYDKPTTLGVLVNFEQQIWNLCQ